MALGGVLDVVLGVSMAPTAVRIALVENRQRLRQAARNIKSFLSGRNDLVKRPRDRDFAAASG